MARQAGEGDGDALSGRRTASGRQCSAQDGDRGSNAILRLHATGRYRAAISREAGADVQGRGPFDHFAPISGKPVAMVVESKDYQQSAGQGNTVYVNLGNQKGRKSRRLFSSIPLPGNAGGACPSDERTIRTVCMALAARLGATSGMICRARCWAKASSST